MIHYAGTTVFTCFSVVQGQLMYFIRLKLLIIELLIIPQIVTGRGFLNTYSYALRIRMIRVILLHDCMIFSS